MLPPVVWLSNYFTSFCGVRTNQGYLTERKNTFDFCNIPFQPSDPYHYWLPHLAPVTFMMDISRNTCFFKISWEWVYTVHCTIMCHMKGHKIQQTTANLSCTQAWFYLSGTPRFNNTAIHAGKWNAPVGACAQWFGKCVIFMFHWRNACYSAWVMTRLKKRLNKTSLKNAVGLTQAVSIS